MREVHLFELDHRMKSTYILYLTLLYVLCNRYFVSLPESRSLYNRELIAGRSADGQHSNT